MANNETTTKFKVDISELKKAMQDAKRAVAVANSEFKEVASTMEDWSKSSEGISAKLKQLDTTLSSQKTVLANYEKQLELTKKQYPEGGKAVDDLIIKINNQKAAINKTEREQKEFKKSLKEVTEAEKIASKTGKDVADVLDEIGKEAEDAGDGFTTIKGAIATFAGNMLTNFVGAVKDGIGSVMGLAEETREYRNELAKLETSFTTAGHTTETATKTYKDLYAVLGDEGQAVEASNFLAKLCKNEEDLVKWTTIATGVYGQFGSSLPIESLTEAANETAKTGSLTGGLADALNWAGVNEDDFQASLDKCTSEQERQALITETLNGLYADSAKKYRETNKSVIEANKANSDYTDSMAELGRKIEPITTALRKGFNKLLQAVLELVDGVDFKGFTKKVDNAFSILTENLLPAVKKGFQWIIDHAPIIEAGLIAIGVAFGAFKVASLITSVTTALSGMSAATALASAKTLLLNSALLANPITLVVALIAGLVAAFVTLWNKSDAFRNFWINLWSTIKSTCSSAISNIVTWFKELPAKIKSIGSNLITGLWTGINNKVDWLKGKIKGFVGNVTSWLKNFFGIHSPSKLMADEIGKWLPEGIAVGIDKNAKSVLSSMKNLAVDTVGATRAGLSQSGAVTGSTIGGGVVNNFYQTINSPKQLSRLDIYRQSKNLLTYSGGVR